MVMADSASLALTIDAPPEHVWALATDFASYPTWARDVKEAVVTSVDDDGRVTEVGPSLPARVDEESYDAAGRWLMPGLWDQHVHLGQWTLASARLDLARVRSSAEAVAAVRERLEERPDLPVIGWGHRPTAWADNPAVSDLDAIDTEQPIVLIAGDGHHGWLNTIALHMLALPTRDSVVTEGEWFRAYGRLAGVVGSDGTSPEAYRRSMEAAWRASSRVARPGSAGCSSGRSSSSPTPRSCSRRTAASCSRGRGGATGGCRRCGSRRRRRSSDGAGTATRTTGWGSPRLPAGSGPESGGRRAGGQRARWAMPSRLVSSIAASYAATRLAIESGLSRSTTSRTRSGEVPDSL